MEDDIWKKSSKDETGGINIVATYLSGFITKRKKMNEFFGQKGYQFVQLIRR